MNTIVMIISGLIGRPPILTQVDINGLITKVTDWEYIFAGTLLLLGAIGVFYGLITILRIVGGMFK